MEEFDYKDHKYTVIPIEGNADECYIIRDGRDTRKVKKEIAEKAMEYVDKLFA